MDLIIRNGNAFGFQGLVDIAIDKGTIVEIGKDLSYSDVKEVDANGKFVSPGLVNAHAHLDKSLIYDRFPPHLQRNVLPDKIRATREIKKEMTIEDVKQRSMEIVKMAVSTGTTAIRTFVEADPLVELRAVKGVLDAKENTKKLVDIQTIAFAQEGWFYTPNSMEMGSEEYLIEALKCGMDIIGGNVNKVVWPSSPEKQIDRLFDLATAFDCDIDMHLDNADHPEAFSLPYLIEKTMEYGYQGRVSAGHVVGIAHVEQELRDDTIKRTKEAGISIAVLPPRIKLTCVRELMEGGVNLVLGTDNIRDTFVFLGNGNMIHSMLLLAHLLKVQTDDELLEIYKMGTTNAAKAMGLVDYGLEVGKRADIVIFDALTFQETILNIAKCQYVIKNGQIVAENGQLLV